MKKIIIIYVILIVAVVALAFMQRGNFNFFNFSKAPTAKIGNKTYSLLLAKSDQERVDGLSNKNNLDKNTGMLFIFPEKSIHSFWMKKVKFPLDIIFIADNKIVTIVENAPVPENVTDDNLLPRYSPSVPVNYVLEVNAGQANEFKFKEGDTVILSNIK